MLFFLLNGYDIYEVKLGPGYLQQQLVSLGDQLLQARVSQATRHTPFFLPTSSPPSFFILLHFLLFFPSSFFLLFVFLLVLLVHFLFLQVSEWSRCCGVVCVCVCVWNPVYR